MRLSSVRRQAGPELFVGCATHLNSIRGCPSMKATFKLSKWHLDCVADLGDASIAYKGMVDWGSVRVHYSSILETRA
jgi:hypothetical protein